MLNISLSPNIDTSLLFETDTFFNTFKDVFFLHIPPPLLFKQQSPVLIYGTGFTTDISMTEPFWEAELDDLPFLEAVLNDLLRSLPALLFYDSHSNHVIVITL